MKLHLRRPRPVLTSAGIAGVITSTVGVLTFLGYDQAAAHLSDMSTVITSVAIGAFAMGSHLLAALHSENKTTPMSSPQDHDGTPLVRQDAIADALSAAPDLSTPDPGPVEVTGMEEPVVPPPS